MSTQEEEATAANHKLDDDAPECDHLVKVIFVGDAAVGKTCLVERLFSDHFNKDSQPTIGVDFRFKRYVIDGQSIGVSLWDTAGAERYSAMTASYFRGAHGVVLVYDVTRRETLTALEQHWLPEVQERMDANVVRLILGNKSDLEGERQVSAEEGARMARRYGCLYYETSACAPGDSVRDALVWGLLASIADNEELLRSYRHEKLNVEQPAPSDRHANHQCCEGGNWLVRQARRAFHL